MADPQYLIADYSNFGMWYFILSILGIKKSPIVASSDKLRKDLEKSWSALGSLFVIALLNSLHAPLLALGEIVESYLNTVNANGGVLNIIFLALFGRHKEIVRPKPGSSSFYSLNGHLDWRTGLDSNVAAQHCIKETKAIFDDVYEDGVAVPPPPETVVMAEICVMSSKLAYENEVVTKRVVTYTWNMNFVGRYDCWNEYSRQRSTHLFIATDKVKNANRIVVAFEGTTPFDTYGYINGLDFSWYELCGLGRVHVGFLEALGLIDRHNLDTFVELQQRIMELTRPHNASILGLASSTRPNERKPLAYDVVTNQLKALIVSNPNAKIYLTGHSLGGALATLYSSLLYYVKEVTLTSRLGGIYTYGQPKVGDDCFCKFLNSKLTPQKNHYMRVVYSNDIIPRIPFDLSSIAEFKHVGTTRFFNSGYNGEILDEMPNKNYFSPTYFIPMEINAIWQIIYNTFFLPWMYGNEFYESTTSLIVRILGLFFPGLASNSLVNYVNSIRLGISKFDDVLW